MPWHVEDDHEGCEGFAVVQDDTGEMESCHDSMDAAQDHIQMLMEGEGMMSGRARPRELVVPLEDVEWRDSGDPQKKDETTLRGHAAVFNSLSDDLGGFREIIEPGFFRAALRRQPDVRLLINHEGLPIARTASGTLELREDNRGLHVFARLDKNDPDVTSLRGKMQRGDVDQMSFAFTLREDGDDWAVAEDGTVIRTLRADGADELFDVSVVTFPAYRHTTVSMRSVLQDAISRGRVPVTVEQAIELASDEAEPAVARGGWITASEARELLAMPEEGSTEVALVREGLDEKSSLMAEVALGGEERDAAPDPEADGAGEVETVDVEQATDLIAELKDSVRATRNEAHESYLRLLKEEGLA